MCNYGFGHDVQDSSLTKQAEGALRRLPECRHVHLTPLGSMFDDCELGPDVRQAIFEAVSAHRCIRTVSTESRPEFVTSEKLECVLSSMGAGRTLELGLGYESASELVRNSFVNKGVGRAAFLRAAAVCAELGVTVTTHVLLKPPFMGEGEAVEDAVDSVREALEWADEVVLMMCNVKPFTVLGWLWQHGFYEPPWLMSAVLVLQRLRAEERRRMFVYGLQSGIRMAASARGCGDCRPQAVTALSRFNQSGVLPLTMLARLCCPDCRKAWENDLESRAETGYALMRTACRFLPPNELCTL